MIDLFTEHAREKLGTPPDWKAFRWECFPKGSREETLYYEVTGAVCKVTFGSGRRKGRTNWGKRDKATEKTAVLPVTEHKKFCDDWEKRTGLCQACKGEGQVFASWNHLTGTKHRPCTRCNETGKAIIT